MKITFFYGFLDTRITVYVKGGEVTPRQVSKIEEALCGKDFPQYPIYGRTKEGATAELTKDGILSIYHEIIVSYNINNLPYTPSEKFHNTLYDLTDDVHGAYRYLGKYLAAIECPVENYLKLLYALQDSGFDLKVPNCK